MLNLIENQTKRQSLRVGVGITVAQEQLLSNSLTFEEV